MDDLGISNSTQQLAEPDRRGLWPRIIDTGDASHWIFTGAGMVLCMAMYCIIVSTIRGNPASAAIEGTFLILGAAGIVRANRFAAAGTTAALALFIVATGRHNPISLIGFAVPFLFIIHAVRSVWFLNRTRQSLPQLNRSRIVNTLGGALPSVVWRAGRVVFFAMAAAGLPWLIYRIFAPIATGAKWRGVVEFPWM